MTLEQQVTSLELSRRLKELGVKQESLFWWSENNHDAIGWNVFYVRENLGREEWFTLDEQKDISAFTVAELGEMLPFRVYNEEGNSCRLVVSKGNDEQREGFQWMVSYEYEDTYAGINSQVGATEADSRAKMLIYLLENKLI